MTILLDGVANRVRIVRGGSSVEIDQDGNVSILNASGCGLVIRGDGIHLIDTKA